MEKSIYFGSNGFLEAIIENRLEREGVIVLIQDDPVQIFHPVVPPATSPLPGVVLPAWQRTPEDTAGLAVLSVVVRTRQPEGPPGRDRIGLLRGGVVVVVQSPDVVPRDGLI